MSTDEGRRPATRKSKARPKSKAGVTRRELPRVPRISVICPLFNSAEYLEETLESVLAQRFRDFELLVVNDGSTDASGAIGQQFADRHPGKVRCLTHPGGVNRGVGASRNLGIREARGEYCAFIDSDDRWRPLKLLEQLAIFERDPAIDVVAGTANYWRSWAGEEDRLVPSGHVRNRVIKPPEASLKVYPLAKASAPCPSDLLVRSRLLRDVGGFEETFTGPLGMYEDQAFLSKVYLHGNVYFDERVWIDYRLHDQSAMHVQLAAGRYHEVRKQFLDWFRAYLQRNPGPYTLRVSVALERAYLRYRLPRLARHVGRAKGLWRKLLSS